MIALALIMWWLIICIGILCIIAGGVTAVDRIDMSRTSIQVEK